MQILCLAGLVLRCHEPCSQLRCAGDGVCIAELVVCSGVRLSSVRLLPLHGLLPSHIGELHVLRRD